MASSVRSQASNSYHLIPKFKEGDIVSYPNIDYWLENGARSIYIYKIDCFEQYGGIGIYRCRMWSVKEKKWVNALRGETIGFSPLNHEHDGKATFQWNSPLERDMEVIEPLGLLVKWGIG